MIDGEHDDLPASRLSSLFYKHGRATAADIRSARELNLYARLAISRNASVAVVSEPILRKIARFSWDG